MPTGDIFPRSELLKAYKNWIGKPLCIDHKSNSVDHVRGVIVDTYYDKLHDRVIALAAIDKVNYADLARKVATGYANSVSMGVGVSKAICSDCGKVAQVEQDFCNHMRTKTGYGEINIGLNPIELSIVVNGADPKAKIKQVLASANFVRKALDNEDNKSDLVDELKNKFDEIKTKLDDLGSKIDSLEDQEEENFDETGDNEVGHISSSSESMHEAETENVNNTGFGQGVRADKQELLQKLASVETNLNNLMKDLKRFNEEQMSVKKAYFQGGGDVNEPTPGKPKYDKEEADLIRNNDDKQMVGQMDTGPVDGMHPGPESVGMNELERKKMLARAEVDERRIRRAAALKDAKERILGAKESFAQATGTVKDMKAGQALASASVCLRDKHGNKTLAGQVATVSDQLKMNGIGAGSLHQILQALKMYSTDPIVMNGVVELERVLNTKQASNNTGTMKREGYFQGGGEANEPTPGKVKYKKEDSDSIRDKEDKQMTGEKPFPNVGPVDGEFPGDKKKKEMLSRADKLSARFVKSADAYGDLDKGSSAWQVFLNDKLVMTASVNELTSNKSEILYEAVANKEFATKMLEKIRSVGLDGAKRLYKQAQTPPAPPPPAPDMGMGMDMGAPPPADPGAPVDQAGAEGDPKEKVNSAVTTLENAVSDLKEGLTALNGEQPQVATDVDLNAMPKAAARELAPLKQMRVKLNSGLRAGFKKAIAKITEQLEELNTVKEIYASPVSNDQKEYISVIVDDSLKAATQSTKEAKELLAAFVKYAKGTEALIKRAEMAEDEMPKDFEDELHNSDESALGELDQKMKEEDHVDLEDSMDSGDLDSESGDSDQEVEDALREMGLGEDSNMDDDSDEDMFDHGNHDDVTEEDSDEDELFNHGDMDSMPEDDDSGMADDMVMVPVKKDQVADMLPKAAFNLNTKEGRAQYRAKLASDAVKFSDMLGKAHPKGGTTVDFDVKPSNKGDHFEDLEEAHKVMLDVAKASPKVRKDAEEIYKLVSSGELDANQVDDLVAQGVDAEAVKYYKEYFGEADGGSEFASELVKDHAKASTEKDMETYRVKLARAYDLAYEMVSRELIPSDNQAVTAQVNEIMTWNDEGFASMKKVIARHSVSSLKKEGSFPTVGLMDSANYAPKVDEDFTDLLSKALSNASRRMF